MSFLLAGFVGEVGGGREGKNVFVALSEEGPSKEATALIVEEILVPVIFDELRNHQDDAALRMLLGELQNVLDDGNDDHAKRRRENGELGRRDAGFLKGLHDVTLPIVMEQFGVAFRLDVDCNDFVGEILEANSRACLETRLQRSMGTTAMGETLPVAGSTGSEPGWPQRRCDNGDGLCEKTTITKGIKITVIHAPCVNLATRTMTTVIPVTKAPRPLTNMPCTQRGPRVFNQ